MSLDIPKMFVDKSYFLMSTLFGKYLAILNIKQTELSKLSGVNISRLNRLIKKEKSKPLPEEYYRIILTAILLSGKPETEFNHSVNEIFPDRPKASFMEEFSIYLLKSGL